MVNATANAQASAALRDTRIYGGLAVFAMLLTLLLIWFVSRAIVGPLRRLTAAAREMSQRQLPALVESLRTGGDVSDVQPTRIEVQSEDEIGELAQAFNDVEAVTMEVAQEQSRLLRKGMGDLFVNLARRNQSLLERQLELLDELERNEHDPAALDALFKLDHMATRMRRNAESLLVLSGAEQPRQWQQPIALLDVVRAAAAEIADFPRVELVGIDDGLAVSGRAVSDVAHLVAELLENATSFSPPDTAVVVSGAVTATGFVLAVSDQGIGMPPERIAEANTLLAKPPVVGLALSRALGLHVVGSLAARHGITVELRARRTPAAWWRSSTCRPRCSSPGPVPAPPAPGASLSNDRSTTPSSAIERRRRAARCPAGRLAPARRAAGGAVAPRGPGRRRAARRPRTPTRARSVPARRPPHRSRSRCRIRSCNRRVRPSQPHPPRRRLHRSPARSPRRRLHRSPARHRAAAVGGTRPAARGRRRPRRPLRRAPLPTRVPGQHLSHHPAVDAVTQPTPTPTRCARTACTSC